MLDQRFSTLHGVGHQLHCLFCQKLASPKLHKFAKDWFSVVEKVQATTLHINAEANI